MVTPLEEMLRDIEEMFEKIPSEHRGIMFRRIFEAFHPQENTRLLERSFAIAWAKENSGHGSPILPSLLCASVDDTDTRTGYLPRNEREWQIAYLVAATIIQWLPTTVGCAFLREAFEAGGGKLAYELPKVKLE